MVANQLYARGIEGEGCFEPSFHHCQPLPTLPPSLESRPLFALLPSSSAGCASTLFSPSFLRSLRGFSAPASVPHLCSPLASSPPPSSSPSPPLLIQRSLGASHCAVLLPTETLPPTMMIALRSPPRLPSTFKPHPSPPPPPPAPRPDMSAPPLATCPPSSGSRVR